MNTVTGVTNLLAIASQSRQATSALIMAFVFNYRCGAVPDSHQVPSCRLRRIGGTDDESILSETADSVKKKPQYEVYRRENGTIWARAGRILSDTKVFNSTPEIMVCHAIPSSARFRVRGTHLARAENAVH